MWPEADLREIRAFLGLSDELHFGRAAERLGVTHARVSQIIRTLEARIGSRLFDRTSRSVRLTPVGAELSVTLRPILARMLAALDGVSQHALARSCSRWLPRWATRIRLLRLPVFCRLPA